MHIDPQQRQVLECTHMALEDAGLTRTHIKGTETGVYIGKLTQKCIVKTLEFLKSWMKKD
jgi:acyl transferase domain-containing protein